MGFFPSGSPRIAQSGSIAYDRWRLQRDQQRDKHSIAMIRPGTDSWAPAEWYQYQHLVTHNPKREYLKRMADETAQRRVREAQQRVRESVSHYKADDSAYREARKRNQYQEEVRRHNLEKIERENARIMNRMLIASARPSFETRPSDFSLSRIGSRLVTSGR